MNFPETNLLSSLEENLGIIATNLALLRTVYLFCRDGPRNSTKQRAHLFQPLFFSSRRVSKPNPFTHPNGLFMSKKRPNTATLDQWSITKTTELDITEEPRTLSSEGLTGVRHTEVWV